MANNAIIVTTNNLNNSNRNRRESDEEEEFKDLPAVSTKKNTRITARVKKEGFLQKFKKAMFGENAERVGEYLIFDVGIPAMKATFADMVTNGIEVLLFGESRGRGSYKNYSAASLSGSRERRGESYRRRASSRTITYEDVLFDSKADANEFLAEVFDYIKEYNRISVAVYSSILSKYCEEKIETTWRDDRRGWYKEDFKGVEPIRTRDGWDIDLPSPDRL